jgi:hypothetical protein
MFNFGIQAHSSAQSASLNWELSPARRTVQTTVEDALREDCRRRYASYYWPKQSIV